MSTFERLKNISSAGFGRGNSHGYRNGNGHSYGCGYDNGDGIGGNGSGDGIGGMSTGGGIGVDGRGVPLLLCTDVAHLGARAVNLIVRMQPP